MRSTCKCGGLDGHRQSTCMQIRGHSLEPRVRQGLQQYTRALGALDRSFPALSPSPHPPTTAEALPTPRASEDCGRKLLSAVVCGPRRAVFGTAAQGQWPMEAALPGICDVQDGEAAARALAASPKTLNFPDFHYNQGGTEKRAGWQMWLLPGCSARRCGARDVWAAQGPSLSGPLIFIDSCTLSSSCHLNPELFIPGTLSGEAKGCLEPDTRAGLPIG